MCLTASDMSGFTLVTGSIASVIYKNLDIFQKDLSMLLLQAFLIGCLHSKRMSQASKMVSKTILFYSLNDDPKWPQYAQSSENRDLLTPKLLMWAFLGNQDFCKISLGIVSLGFLGLRKQIYMFFWVLDSKASAFGLFLWNLEKR